MDNEHNKAVVRRLFDEVVGRGNMELVAELCAADVINHAAAPNRQHGVENYRAVLESSRKAQPDQSWVEQRV
ncbi:MAG: ester cyclase, partial [Actinobacteria bacterium]|nr:ester cyclase [Actinomycetota bacterium]